MKGQLCNKKTTTKKQYNRLSDVFEEEEKLAALLLGPQINSILYQLCSK